MKKKIIIFGPDLVNVDQRFDGLSVGIPSDFQLIGPVPSEIPTKYLLVGTSAALVHFPGLSAAMSIGLCDGLFFGRHFPSEKTNF